MLAIPSARAPRMVEDASASTASNDALALSKRPASRFLSKNCKNLKKYGIRLYGRRHERQQTKQARAEVERMREELRCLDERLSMLDSIALTMRQNAQAAAMQTVRTYFRHMKHGLDPSAIAYDREVTAPFIRAALTEDVKCQDFTGLESFFRQWEIITKFHERVTMTNDSLLELPIDLDLDDPHGERCVIKASGLTSCRISRDTLVHFFPHILQDEALVQVLMGKEYGYGYTMILHVNADGRIFQFESKIDLASGLLMLLHDPMVTIKMIESSQWTNAGNLRSSEVEEDQHEIDNSFL